MGLAELCNDVDHLGAHERAAAVHVEQLERLAQVLLRHEERALLVRLLALLVLEVRGRGEEVHHEKGGHEDEGDEEEDRRAALVVHLDHDLHGSAER